MTVCVSNFFLGRGEGKFTGGCIMVTVQVWHPWPSRQTVKPPKHSYHYLHLHVTLSTYVVCTNAK